MNATELDLIAKGFVQQPNGSWAKPPRQVDRTAPSPEPQQVVRHAPDGQVQRKEENTGRFLVSIESFRVRLIDPDNLCAKYFLDCCRYSQLIPNDRPEDIEFKVSQTRCESKSMERTEITIERIKL